MGPSQYRFKYPKADLHRKSPYIFAASLFISVIFLVVALHIPLPRSERPPKRADVPPVIIQLQNIPQTRHREFSEAPPRPVVEHGLPIPVEEFIEPDDITIEDTTLDTEAPVQAAPAVTLAPVVGASKEEDEIYEYYAVEEQPERTTIVQPEFPALARRANIEGTVLLRVLVNREGAVDSVTVEHGPEIFRKSAIKAALATKFSPARQNNTPVACWVLMPFRFDIQD